MPDALTPYGNQTPQTSSNPVNFGSSKASHGEETMDEAAQRIANQAGDLGYGLANIANSLIAKISELQEAFEKFSIVTGAEAAQAPKENWKDFYKRATDGKISVKRDGNFKGPKAAFRVACQKIIAEEGNEDLVRYVLENIDAIEIVPHTPDREYDAEYESSSNTLRVVCDFENNFCNHVNLRHELQHFIEIAHRQFVEGKYFEKCMSALRILGEQAKYCISTFTEACKTLADQLSDYKDRVVVVDRSAIPNAGKNPDEVITVASRGNAVVKLKSTESSHYQTVVGTKQKDGSIDTSNSDEKGILYSASFHIQNAETKFDEYRNQQGGLATLYETAERGPHLSSAAPSSVIGEFCKPSLKSTFQFPEDQSRAIENILRPTVITKSADARYDKKGIDHNSEVIPNPPSSVGFVSAKPTSSQKTPGRNEF